MWPILILIKTHEHTEYDQIKISAFIKQRVCKSLKIKKPTRCHLLFYCTSYRLNMFRTLLCPSSGARGYVVDYHIGRIVLGLLCVGS